MPRMTRAEFDALVAANQSRFWDLSRVERELMAVLMTGRTEDGSPFTLPITTGPAEWANLGRAFVVGSGRISLAVAGNVRGIVQNPAGSGVNVIVAGLTIFGTGTSWTTLYLNPTAGVPTTPNRPGMNAVLGGGFPRQSIMRVDTDATVALSGGTDTGVVMGSGGNQSREANLPFPLILAPGVTVGMNVPFAGAADAAFNVNLLEVPA